MQFGRLTLMLLCTAAIAFAISACDDEFKIAPRTITIAENEVVFSSSNDGVTLRLAADSALTAFEVSSFSHPLGVVGTISGRNTRGVILHQTTRLNAVSAIVDGVDGPDTVNIRVGDVRYRGVNMHFVLRESDLR